MDTIAHRLLCDVRCTPISNPPSIVYTLYMEVQQTLVKRMALLFVGVMVIVALYFVAYSHISRQQSHRVSETPDTSPVFPPSVDSIPEAGNTNGTSTVVDTTSPIVPPNQTPETPEPIASSSSIMDVPVLPLPPVIATYNTRVGLAVGETLSVVSEEELVRRMNDFADIGVRWLRIDVAWSSVQPDSPDEYRWDAIDRIVRHANARNIAILALITYTPEWAQSDVCRGTKKCEPRDPSEFATFAGEVAKRYTPYGVYHYQIWNEPNMRFFWASGANPERYVALLKESARAIRAVNNRATIVSGGLAAATSENGNMPAREFLENMYENGARGSFDILGYHPYSYPLAPHYYALSSPWSQIADTEWSIRSVMEEYGDSAVQVWITEYGAPTEGPGSVANTSDHGLLTTPTHVTETFQATILREAFEENEKFTFSGPLFWYSYQDLATSVDTVENHFGILRADGSKKPSYHALFQVARK